MAENAEVSCSLTAEKLRMRRTNILSTLVPRVVQTERLSDGFRVQFDDSVSLRKQVKEFVSLEQRCCGCCGFLSFAISPPDEGLVLSIQGPPEASGALELFRSTLVGQ